jgi:ABC-type glycerol-3-phosphate transport system permease component
MVFKNNQIWTGYMNSAIYAIGGTLISTTLTLMAAYPLSCKHMYGRTIFMWIFLFTMLFSGGLIPTYVLLRDLGMIGTRWAMVIPHAIAVWLLIITRSFFQSTIPSELHEAASIDGCSEFKYFLSILIPLSKPIIAVVALNYAVFQWNSYFHALIYLTDSGMHPLQIVLRNILILNQMDVNQMADIEDVARRQGLAVAMRYPLIVVATAPLLVVYPFVQKYFVKGIMVGSLKG